MSGCDWSCAAGAGSGPVDLLPAGEVHATLGVFRVPPSPSLSPTPQSYPDNVAWQ